MDALRAKSAAVVLILTILAATLGAGRAHAEDDLEALKAQSAKLYEQGRYRDALPLAARILALTETQFGAEHFKVAEALNDIGIYHLEAGSFADAQAYCKRAVDMYTRTLGDHADTADATINLGMVARARGQLAEAEADFRRAIAMHQKAGGPESPKLGRAFAALADLAAAQGRYGEAEQLFKQALAIDEKALGPDHPTVGIAFNNLGTLYNRQGRLAEAETFMRRSVDVQTKALGPDHPSVAVALNNLAEIERAKGNFAEAEHLYKRSLRIRESTLGPDHPDVATALNDLAALYRTLERFAEAEALYQRAIAIYRKALGPDHPSVANVLNSMAQIKNSGFDGSEKSKEEAEALYKQALEIREKALGPDHPDVSQSLNNLAVDYAADGRLDEAEALYRRSIAIVEKTVGKEHPDYAIRLNNLAFVYSERGQLAESAKLYEESLAITQRLLGPNHPEVAKRLHNLAATYLQQGDLPKAADAWRRSTGLLISRARHGGGPVNAGLSSDASNEAQRAGLQFSGLVKTVYRTTPEDAAAINEMFEAVQWAKGSDAADSISQMAARRDLDSPRSALVRERQDLVAEWQVRDKRSTESASLAPEARNADTETANRKRLAEIETRISDIDRDLATQWPSLAALTERTALSIADVQQNLREDEALVLFYDTTNVDKMPQETFIWAVTKHGAKWARSDIGSRDLINTVGYLRCDLDPPSFTADTKSTCLKFYAGQYAEAAAAGKPPPFEARRAHELYQGLFGGIEDVIRNPDGTGKHLLLVTHGALQQLPLQVLVTEEPAEGKPTAWLMRRHATTTLPSVASLAALRSHAPTAAASARKPYVAFANPLLAGKARSTEDMTRAAFAEAKSNCAKVAAFAELDALRAQFAGGDALAPLLGGVADTAEIRSFAPVPQTADLACAVAAKLGVGEDDVYLGARATESNLKAMSASGALASYRIVNFATHGTVGGAMKPGTEPGLILTPPVQGSEADDGYLSAPEVAALRLDADWVTLSACNTAAGNADNAGALSGLARAFFFAGARTLLVSHWSVRADAAVALVTSALAATAADKTLGRAEALRRAMVELADSNNSDIAHPSYWAPFVVVGEGGAPD